MPVSTGRFEQVAVSVGCRKAGADRNVTIRPAPDCMAYVSGLLPVAEGVAAYAITGRHRHAATARVAAMTTSDPWDAEAAARYDDHSDEMFSPEVLHPTVDFLAALAGDGPALELAIGTGRVGVPLRVRGVPVTGIELSEPMVEQLRHKVDEQELPVAVGDMATTRVPGEFALVYLVYNTIDNLRTQDEQVDCFRNASRHLRAGGRFVIEVGVPPLRRFPPGQAGVPFDISDGHLGFDTYDLVDQQGTSHHYRPVDDDTARYGVHHFRYVWPSECDLMARLAGLELEERWADWHRTPFTSDSESHVSVWRKPLVDPL